MTWTPPDVADDPNVQKALQATAAFTTEAQAARANARLTQLARTEAINTAWTAANEKIAAAFNAWRTAASDRLAVLEQVVPFGPGIPEGTSPADREVLQSSFSAKLDKARNAGGAGDRQALLTDALKYGDDMAVRAVMSACTEAGEGQVLLAWADRTGHADEVAEAFYLQGLLSGSADGFITTRALRLRQVFAPIPTPAEVNDLPALRRVAELAANGEASPGLNKDYVYGNRGF